MTPTALPPRTLAHTEWPGPDDAEAPKLPGFTASPFGPIIAHVADRCLGAHHGEPPTPPERGERTAVVLVTRLGDMATEAAVTGSVDSGKPASPLLFYQSVPSAVLGVVAARWGLGGPVICISPAGDALADGMDLAQLLIEDGSADDVLLVLVELATRDDQPDRARGLLVTGGTPTDDPGSEAGDQAAHSHAAHNHAAPDGAADGRATPDEAPPDEAPRDEAADGGAAR